MEASFSSQMLQNPAVVNVLLWMSEVIEVIQGASLKWKFSLPKRTRVGVIESRPTPSSLSSVIFHQLSDLL